MIDVAIRRNAYVIESLSVYTLPDDLPDRCRNPAQAAASFSFSLATLVITCHSHLFRLLFSPTAAHQESSFLLSARLETLHQWSACTSGHS
jgi:hypothetical protein